MGVDEGDARQIGIIIASALIGTVVGSIIGLIIGALLHAGEPGSAGTDLLGAGAVAALIGTLIGMWIGDAVEKRLNAKYMQNRRR
jgi:fructose-specific phosphotransferase system IIC component